MFSTTLASLAFLNSCQGTIYHRASTIAHHHRMRCSAKRTWLTYSLTYAHNLIWGPHFRVLRHWSLRDQRRTATTSCERHQSKVTLWNIYIYIHTCIQYCTYIHTYIHKWTSCMAFKLWNTVELVIGPRSLLLFQEFPSIRQTERQTYSKFENNDQKNINFNLSLCPELLDG